MHACMESMNYDCVESVVYDLHELARIKGAWIFPTSQEQYHEYNY